MTVLRYFFRRLRALRRSEDIHDEIAEEMRFHIELRAEENVRRGMAPEEARREAERQFGRFSRIKEQGYDVRGGRWLEATWQDLRFGARMLMKQPGFTCIAILTLALGIGANTAIFSLVDKMLVRKLPVEEPDRLVVVSANRGQGVSTTSNYPDFVDYRDRNEVFEGLVAYYQRSFTLSKGGQAERVQGMIVSGNYFTALRVRLALGRGFLPEEDKSPGTHPVVVLGYGLWQRRFDAEPGVVGKAVSLNGYPYTVVGIAPPEFTGTIAIRLATGAGRMRLIRQLLTESVLLSALGGGAGLALAASISGFIAGFTPPNNAAFSSLTLDNRLDLRVLGFTLAISLLTGILFGLAPALIASRQDLVPALKDEATVVGRKRRYFNFRNLLVVGQVAISVIVLIGAGLCVRSLRNLNAIDTGFDPARVLVVSVDLSLSGYNRERGLRFYSELVERVQRLRGVEAVSLATQIALGDGFGAVMRAEGYVPKPDEDISSDFNQIWPDYFRVMKIPLLEGRDFGQSDTPTAPPVAIINETAARRYWAGQSAVGRRVIIGRPPYDQARVVVGVVKDSKYRRLTEELRPAVFTPFLQRYRGDMSLHVRTTGDPGAMLAAVRREVQALDASLPLYNIKTLEEQKSSSLYTSRMAATLLTVFGLLALGLAAVGLSGVMAYAVNRRTREIGIRMALGARGSDVLRQMLLEGMSLVTIGLVLGLGGAVAATRLVKGFLYDVTTTDPVSFAGAALLLAGVALLANYLPARRASRTSPLVALRCDQ